mmetsp:Transcript_22583/g.33456  ORF Transcript_22583/g.33456 Transcript_22583/m.33456 type:complete len:227 (+) Transcript_22583:95-775(+)
MYFLYRQSFLLFAVSSLTLYTGAIANECEDQYNAIIFLSNVCDPVEGSDQCPASCQESLDMLDTACSVDGATISGEPYQASTNLAAALIFVDEPCKSVVGDELLSQVEDTCQDIGTLYLSTSVIFCGDDDTPACSPFCQGVLDGFYRSCAVDDEVMTEDFTGKVSLPVSQIRVGYHAGLSEACKEYGKGKEFEGSSTSSSSVSSISIFPVILSLVVSSVCFPSWLA